MPDQTSNGPFVGQDQIRSIWQACGLGAIDHIMPTLSGMRNESYIVNREWFLRLNTLDPGLAKFGNERRVAIHALFLWVETIIMHHDRGSAAGLQHAQSEVCRPLDCVERVL